MLWSLLLVELCQRCCHLVKKQKIFEIRSCIEILANDIKVNTADEYTALQLTKNCKVYILEDHPLGGKNVLNMCALFEDDQ